jgi:hypothetical protein
MFEDAITLSFMQEEKLFFFERHLCRNWKHAGVSRPAVRTLDDATTIPRTRLTASPRGWDSSAALALASPLQGDFSGGLSVSHPSGSPARGDQVTPAIAFQQIDGDRAELAGFASADFEQVVVGEPNTEADVESEDAVEDFLAGGRFAERGNVGTEECMKVIVVPADTGKWPSAPHCAPHAQVPRFAQDDRPSKQYNQAVRSV